MISAIPRDDLQVDVRVRLAELVVRRNHECALLRLELEPADVPEFIMSSL